MDTLSMIMNAQITDMNGEAVGSVISVHIVGCKMFITASMEYESEEDGDDGEKEDIPEDDASKTDPTELTLVAVGGDSI